MKTNYRSKQEAWAIDRATEFHRVAKTEGLTLDKLLADAKIISLACYDAEEDFEHTAMGLGDIIKTVPDPLSKVQSLIGELQMIEEQIERQKPIGTEH